MSAKRVFALITVACVLLIALTSIAAAQPLATAPAVGEEDADLVASGGRYRLTSLAWPLRRSVAEANAVASGGSYRLLVPALRGSGCCCTYLPCVIRASH